MPRKSVICCWKKSNTEERRLVSTTSWKDMVAEVIEEFELHPSTTIKLYMPDGLTVIKEKYFDRLLDDGLQVVLAQWDNEELYENVSISLYQLDLPETPATSTTSTTASVCQNKVSTKSNQPTTRNKQFDIYTPDETTIACTLEYPETAGKAEPLQSTTEIIVTNTTESVHSNDGDRKNEGYVPIPYPLPQFPPSLEQTIIMKREGVKIVERITNAIIKILREDMLMYLKDCLYPTMLQYKAVCDSLIKKYPFLADDAATGVGIALWRNKLRRSFRTMRSNKPDTPQSLEKKMIYANSNSSQQDRNLKSVNSPAVKKSPRQDRNIDPMQRWQQARFVENHEELRLEISRQLEQDNPSYDRIQEILVKLRPLRQKTFREAENLLTEFNMWPALHIPSLLYGEVLSEIESTISPNEFQYKISTMLQDLLPTFFMKLKRSAQFQEMQSKYQDHDLLSLFALSCLMREDLRFFLVEADTPLNEVSREIIIQVSYQAGELSYKLLFDRAVILDNIYSAIQAVCMVFCLHFVLNLNFASPKIYEVIQYCLTGQRPRNMSAKTFITKFSLEKLK